jgi:hypothetical protein
MGIGVGRRINVAGQDVEQERHISSTLHIVLTTQGIDTTAGTSHVAKQKLDQRKGFYVLAAHSVLGDTHGIAYGAGFVRSTGAAEQIQYLLILVFGRTGYLAYRINIIAGIMFLHELENTVRVLQSVILMILPSASIL